MNIQSTILHELKKVLSDSFCIYFMTVNNAKKCSTGLHFSSHLPQMDSSSFDATSVLSSAIIEIYSLDLKEVRIRASIQLLILHKAQKW